jgi:hypothetical protein
MSRAVMNKSHECPQIETNVSRPLFYLFMIIPNCVKCGRNLGSAKKALLQAQRCRLFAVGAFLKSLICTRSLIPPLYPGIRRMCFRCCAGKNSSTFDYERREGRLEINRDDLHPASRETWIHLFKISLLDKVQSCVAKKSIESIVEHEVIGEKVVWIHVLETEFHRSFLVR